MEIVLNVRSENLDNNLTAVDSNFSKPNYYGISISVLKGSVCKGRLAFSLFSEKIKISKEALIKAGKSQANRRR